MASIDLIRASDGSGNAAVATVQNSRSSGSSTIVVDTVAGINDTFVGSMGTPHTFIDPETAEEITVISEATAVDFAGHVDGANLEIDDIAPGYTDLGSAVDDIVIIRPTTQWADNIADTLDVSHNDDGTLKSAIVAYNMLTTNLINGWIDANETWVYVSGTGTVTGVLKIVGIDLTGKYQAGDKVKFTQNATVKYGIITKVAFSTDTTITLLMSATSGTVDNTGLENATISANYYSRARFPFGFPADPARWTISVTSTTDRSRANTAYGTLTDAITAPIGVWHGRFKAHIQIITDASTTTRNGWVTLSSDASTETNSETTMTVTKKSASAAVSTSGGTKVVTFPLTVTSPTTFTMIGKTSDNGATVGVQGSTNTATIIRLICAYL